MSVKKFPKRADVHRRSSVSSTRASLAAPVPAASAKGAPALGATRAGGVRPLPTPAERKAIFEHAMGRALFLANRAREGGDVPVGAVVIDEWGTILGQGWNTREAAADPTGHAEVMALRAAAKRRGTWRLEDLTLVVTLEPCTMCAGAVVNSRVKRLVMGAWDPKAGAAGSVRDVVRDSRLNHQVEVVPGVLQTECEIQLRGFFSTKRTM
ncbi:MAG: tRNA adenosine(34) deaminase TadA [Actinomycetaceae bacterium]|nr:tRNA adenosine(34) deaminase TadA [Actinomycetaceae bacterium]